jgi:hypothetical protein
LRSVSSFSVRSQPQVHGRRVGRPEGAFQWQQVAGEHAQRLREAHPGRVHQQRHSALIDASPPGAARHLAVLVRREQASALAVELEHLAHDHRPRGHVDAQRERVGGEDGAQRAGLKELFDQQLDLRQQPRVMHGDSAR